MASTTGNIYGIYDLSGGAWERVAAYISNGHSNLSNGSSFAKKTADIEGYKKWSDKYVTVYPYDSSSDTTKNNYIKYKNENYGYGDAILETSSSENNVGWFEDTNGYPYQTRNIFSKRRSN